MKNYEDLIGTQVKWQIKEMEIKGLFLQVVGDEAEVICYWMGYKKCHVRLFIKLEMIEFCNQ